MEIDAAMNSNNMSNSSSFRPSLNRSDQPGNTSYKPQQHKSDYRGYSSGSSCNSGNRLRPTTPYNGDSNNHYPPPNRFGQQHSTSSFNTFLHPHYPISRMVIAVTSAWTLAMLSHNRGVHYPLVLIIIAVIVSQPLAIVSIVVRQVIS